MKKHADVATRRAQWTRMPAPSPYRGLLVENSPFGRLASSVALHLRPSLPLDEAMVGTVGIDRGIWKKAR